MALTREQSKGYDFRNDSERPRTARLAPPARSPRSFLYEECDPHDVFSEIGQNIAALRAQILTVATNTEGRENRKNREIRIALRYHLTALKTALAMRDRDLILRAADRFVEEFGGEDRRNVFDLLEKTGITVDIAVPTADGEVETVAVDENEVALFQVADEISLLRGSLSILPNQDDYYALWQRRVSMEGARTRAILEIIGQNFCGTFFSLDDLVAEIRELPQFAGREINRTYIRRDLLGIIRRNQALQNPEYRICPVQFEGATNSSEEGDVAFYVIPNKNAQRFPDDILKLKIWGQEITGVGKPDNYLAGIIEYMTSFPEGTEFTAQELLNELGIEAKNPNDPEFINVISSFDHLIKRANRRASEFIIQRVALKPIARYRIARRQNVEGASAAA